MSSGSRGPADRNVCPTVRATGSARARAEALAEPMAPCGSDRVTATAGIGQPAGSPSRSFPLAGSNRRQSSSIHGPRGASRSSMPAERIR